MSKRASSHGALREVEPHAALIDARDHHSSPSDVNTTLNELRNEVAVLREALMRTYVSREGLMDGCRNMREAIVKYAGEHGMKELISSIPVIPDADPVVDCVVQRASIIDSGKSCADSCRAHFCIGSACPFYAVINV